MTEEVVDRDAPDQPSVVHDSHRRGTGPNHDRGHLHQRVVRLDKRSDVAVVWHQIRDKPTLQAPVQDLGRALLEDVREHACFIDIRRKEATEELAVREDADEPFPLVDDEYRANFMARQDRGGLPGRRVGAQHRLRTREVPRLHPDAPPRARAITRKASRAISGDVLAGMPDPSADQASRHTERTPRILLVPLMVVTAPFGRYPQRALADSRLAQPVVANRAQRRNGNRRRRLPLAVLLAPVALVAAGIVLFMVVSGGDGGGLIGGDDEDEAAPPFDFRVGRVRVERVIADADTSALKTEAQALVTDDITPVIDALWTDGFLDSANWRQGDYEELYALFEGDAAATAQSSVDVLTLGAAAGEEFERVTPDRGGITYTVLFDRDNNPDTVTASVRFRATAELKDGTFVVIVSAGQLFLQESDGWKVIAFDVNRNDRETAPPTPSPSGATPSATGATG